MKTFENVIFELLLETLLVIKALSQMSDLVCKSFLSHPQVVHNECQVLVHSVKVLKLLSHLVGLLV